MGRYRVPEDACTRNRVSKREQVGRGNCYFPSFDVVEPNAALNNTNEQK
jgi:hypothetical protein